MTPTLRTLLLVAAVLTVLWILAKIRANRMRQEDTLFWICFAILLLIMGVFPKTMYTLASLFGVQAPSNLVFLIIIALLSEKMFSLSAAVSKLQNQVEVLAAELALRTMEKEDGGEAPRSAATE